MEKKLTDSGAKSYQRGDMEDRSKEFRDFHRSLDKTLYATDLDLIEWRYINGVLTPVGVLEITRVDQGKQVNDQYKSEILKRYDKRDMQGLATRTAASLLGVKAWIVLYRKGCSEFWIYSLTDNDQRWYHYDRDRLERWLLSLGEKAAMKMGKGTISQ